jgi:hypothetical protein
VWELSAAVAEVVFVGAAEHQHGPPVRVCAEAGVQRRAARLGLRPAFGDPEQLDVDRSEVGAVGGVLDRCQQVPQSPGFVLTGVSLALLEVAVG